MQIAAERGRLVKNAVLNLLGQIIPLIVGVLCVPHIANELGPERFGVLSLAWLIIASLSIFDLGMGRAMVKFVAETLGKDDLASLPRLVWSTILAQAALGIIGSLSGVIFLQVLGDRVLRVSPETMSEALTTFYLLTLGLPVMMVASSLSNVLEGAQRFDITNAIRSLSLSASFLLPVVAVEFGFNLTAIIGLLILSKVLALVTLFVAVQVAIPVLRLIQIDLSVLREVLRFGGWISVTNTISPVLVNLDRYLLAVMLPITAVGYYTPANQAISYLAIIPASVTSSLFPAFSVLNGIGRHERIHSLFARSLKYTLLTVAPLIAVIAAFPNELLTLWIGQEYAREAATALRVLALGVLINALAFSPSTLLQAVGRPDIPAKFHLLELPIHAGITWFCIHNWGVTGAAIAWSIRVSLDATLLFSAAFTVLHDLRRYMAAHKLILCAALAGFFFATLVAVGVLAGEAPSSMRVLLIVTAVAVFGAVVWVTAIDSTDRDVIKNFCLLIREQSSFEKPSGI